MKMKGYISTFFQSRGFGFINSTVEGKLVSYFFHISACQSEPIADAEVEFTPSAGKKGLLAVDVEILSEAQ